MEASRKDYGQFEAITSIVRLIFVLFLMFNIAMVGGEEDSGYPEKRFKTVTLKPTATAPAPTTPPPITPSPAPVVSPTVKNIILAVAVIAAMAYWFVGKRR